MKIFFYVFSLIWECFKNMYLLENNENSTYLDKMNCSYGENGIVIKSVMLKVLKLLSYVDLVFFKRF